jgi:hypothetical protein
MRAKAAVLGLVAVLLFAGCGDDKDDNETSTPTTTLSQAQLDKQKAQRINLTAPDLPGYAQDPPDPSSESSPEFEAAANACANNNPVFVALATDSDARGATSPDFSKGETVTVSSSVTFAETEDQARTTMTEVGAASFPACFSRAFTAEIRTEPTYSNVSVTTTKLPAITAGDQSLGYRVVVKFRTEGTNLTANFDMTLIRVGRAVASVDAYSLTTPFPAAERLRLATLVAGRMAAP